MAFVRSSLSLAATELRRRLASAIQDLDEQHILIAHPKEGVDKAASDNHHYLNLFFYRVESGSHPADCAAADPFFVRLHCLITALAADDSGSQGVSAGENDLRLLGEVMRVLHEAPYLTITDVGDTVASLQIVLQPLSLDDVNRVWSTQGDTAYRLSVAYEMALAPVPPSQPRPLLSQRIASVGVEARPAAEAPQLPTGGFGVTARTPLVGITPVDGSRSDWVPHVALVVDGTELEYTLALEPTQAAADVRVLIAGAVGEHVSVLCELWSASGGWRRQISSPTATYEVMTDTIDPTAIVSAHVHDVPGPFGGSPPPAQALLYAVRRPGTPREIRSNPLLLTLVASTSP